MRNRIPFLRKQGVTSFMSSIIAILCGVAFGFVLLLIFNSQHALKGLSTLLATGFGNSEKFAKVLYQTSPLIMTGLSVGFAFKTGLFNIGATGQYLIGGMCSLIAALVFKQPWYCCMLFAMVGGAVWGIFPGLFKAVFNVNEVITSIMFNWIALFLVNVVFSNLPSALANFYGGSIRNRTAMLDVANPSAIIPKWGLDTLLNSKLINISPFIAIIFAVIVVIILNKTTFGYELKACGYNKDASVYAGINAKSCIILSMLVAGALSGVAGGMYYLSGTSQYVIDKLMPAMGFNGIPVALLAASHPIGIIFSAFFISYIQVGGGAMQPEFATETVDIIVGAIIYLSAFSLLMRDFLGRLGRSKITASEHSGVAIKIPGENTGIHPEETGGDE